jgi:hypothetical protein
MDDVAFPVAFMGINNPLPAISLMPGKMKHGKPWHLSVSARQRIQVNFSVFVMQICYAYGEVASDNEGSDPNGIRTRVTAVKGRCPRPLDDRVSERQISRRGQGLQAAFVVVNPITHKTSAWLARRKFFNEYCCSGSRFSMRLNYAKSVVCQLFSLRGATQ